MRFQVKMIIGYAILMLALALIIGLGHHNYTVNQYEKAEVTNMQVVADQLVMQVEERISRMELATEYILSDPRILEGIHILGMDDDGISRAYINEAKSAIQSGIGTYYITNNFYRAIWFNRSGEVFSTYNYVAKKAKSVPEFEKMPYLEEADLRNGKPVLVSAHEDNWGGLPANPQVFSLAKAVQGNNRGYIEIQYLVSEFGELPLPKEGISYVILVNNQELLYSNWKKDITVLSPILKAEEQSIVQKMEQENGEQILVAKTISKKYPIVILAMEDMKELRQYSAYTAPMTFAIALAFFVVSMIFVIILSHILTKPLHRLKMVMENTELENLNQAVALNTPDDEFQALSVSYQRLLRRLQESMVKEKRLSTLQLQAQFDSLQAQVNPHFLYNVLNIISARGMGSGDERICEMCGSLASMLRYSTNNKERYATLEQEMEYLEQYFYLLKARYDYKIEFKVSVEESIKKEIVPKVALQQIVENCINHGFEHSIGQMCVEITGWRDEDGWYIKIHDNGQGFKKEVLSRLEQEMDKTRQQIFEGRRNMEMEIGGMGLLNTYARLRLLYDEKLVFMMKNGNEGAEVIVGYLESKKE